MRMSLKGRMTGLAAGIVAGVVALAGCSAAPSGEDGGGAEQIAVVSGLGNWGDLAAVIGGDAVKVTSIIDRPEKDPHEYEATTRDQLALSRAEVVIKNGGGFDAFIDRMLAASDDATATVLSVEDIASAGRDDEERNEHFWYDFESVKEVVAAIAGAFSELDPENAATFEANLDSLNGELDALIERRDALATEFAGTPIGITEPLAYYLLESIGLDDLTPEGVGEALEEGSDVPPSLMLENLRLYSDGAVDVLVYKEQRVGPQNEQIRSAAEEAGIPVVFVQETFEPGSGYIEWMNATLDSLQSALDQ